MSASGEQIVQANGVDLCVETFGDPADRAMLLIDGAGNSMLSRATWDIVVPAMLAHCS